MATLTRSTPNFALPATQNTAPVHEFRCLYTHDIRKKAKKWHDGSARFHTFNRRVMVYDDAKNYIGDQHYRADDEFGEGTELQLDRGVLVEVGERVGVTQTDLTGIIHRPNVDAVSTPNASAGVRSHATQRTNNVNTQARPKSLTEVLGTKQNRVGRATLPITSPFEQRQALAETQHVERSAKRQKVLAGKENTHLSWQTSDATRSNQEVSSSSIIASSPVLSRFQKQPNVAARKTDAPARKTAAVVDISSDEDVPRRSKTATERANKAFRPDVLQERAKDTTSRKRSKGNETSPKRNAQKRQISPPLTSARPLGALARPVSVSTGSSSSTKSLLKPGMSSLKMRSQEPRRKLMYKALLPASVGYSEPDITGPIAQQYDEVIDAGRRPTQELTHDANAIEEDIDLDLDEFDKLRDPTPDPVPDIVSVPQQPQQTPRKHQTPLSPSNPSPMFFSQRASQRSPTPIRDFIEDDFDIPATQSAQKDDETLTNQIIDNAIRISDDEDTPEPDSPYFPLPPPQSKPTYPAVPATIPPPRPLTTLLPRPVPPPAAQRTPSPKKARLLTRSLSEHDSPLPNDPRISPFPSLLAPVEDSPSIPRRQPSPFNPPAQQPRNPSPNKSAFQRCRSDTAAIIPINALDSEVPPESTEEQGPWTKLEAFLLFDKWPMCKQKDKPVFEPLPDVDQDASMEDSESSDGGRGMGGFVRPVVGARAVQPVLIRSAKALLRDG